MMTRQTRAKWLALATAALVVLLAAVFSALRNRPPQALAVIETQTTTVLGTSDTVVPSSAPAGPAPAADEARLAAGRRAYVRLGCASCHSIAGRGNPSHPLDGVGSRLAHPAIRDFTAGTGAARETLGADLARIKAGSVDDPDFEALVDFLTQLK